ncbi:MAG: hypothetical protein KDE55_21040 [Novosphingobium sp.]|nr:hypothetical protein [Novosphingobium sp.]
MSSGAGGTEILPSILDYLGELDEAVAQLSKTWKPNDPAYRADVYRQIMMNLSYAYFVYFHADAEHPDWAPLWNPVYLQQPNPDTLYLHAPLRGDLTYRVSGDRGTCHSIVFQTRKGFAGGAASSAEMTDGRTFDVKDMEVGKDGEFEVIFSAKRPAGYKGNWAQITPATDTLMVRYISQDWGKERDPRLSIECLDPVPPKARLTPEQIIERIKLMAAFPANMDRVFFPMQDGLKQRAGVNKFVVEQWAGVEFQAYWPAVFEFSPGEALIIETELPEKRPYWNIQVNDPYFNIVEYVYRLSSTNGAMATISSDGKFRAVVALEDPGVPNWLDTAGFTEGTLWGRWYDCSSTPLPTLKRVPFDKVRDHLPADTPVVTPAQRAEEIRARVRACQRRRRW